MLSTEAGGGMEVAGRRDMASREALRWNTHRVAHCISITLLVVYMYNRKGCGHEQNNKEVECDVCEGYNG